MQQFCPYGSVRGASGNRRPYRDKAAISVEMLSSQYAEFMASRR
jgi:hypothetical protein